MAPSRSSPPRSHSHPRASPTHASPTQHHTLLIDSKGAILACGNGVGGRLGLVDHPDPRSTAMAPRSLAVPRKLPFFGGERRATAIAAGIDYSLAVTDGGGLYSWGAAGAPLGYTQAHDQLTPRLVRLGGAGAAPLAEHVAAGGSHALVATRCGKVYYWGGSRRGHDESGPSGRGSCEMGVMDGDDQQWVVCPIRVDAIARSCIVHVAASGTNSAACARDGTLFNWDVGSPTVSRVKLPRSSAAIGGLRSHHHRGKPIARRVACGVSHTVALTTDGQLYGWDSGRAPHAVSLGSDPVVAISATRYTTVATTASGHVYTWEEHWHTGWVPQPARVPEIVQAACAVAAEHHYVAIVEQCMPRVPPLTLDLPPEGCDYSRTVRGGGSSVASQHGEMRSVTMVGGMA